MHGDDNPLLSTLLMGRVAFSAPSLPVHMPRFGGTRARAGRLTRTHARNLSTRAPVARVRCVQMDTKKSGQVCLDEIARFIQRQLLDDDGPLGPSPTSFLYVPTGLEQLACMDRH